MHVAFILPGDAGADHAYAAGMVDGLRHLGHAADLTVAGHPADAAADLPPGTVAVLDVMGLRAGDDPAATRPDTVALVHHPGAGSADAARAALPRFRRVIATSVPIGSRLTQEFGVAPDRVHVIEPGQPPLPRSTGSGGPGCAVLSVGVLTARKGHDVLLRALARLFDLDWTLTIAGNTRGDPDYPATLDALAAELGVAGRVAVLRGPAIAALDELWRRADLFALATRWEAYPGAVAQALRRGLPVATTAAVAGLMTDDTGAMCPVDDVDQMSKALRRLVFDTELRAAVADAAWMVGQGLPGWTEQARRLLAVVGG